MKLIIGVLLLPFAAPPAHPYDSAKTHPSIVANAWALYCQAHPQESRCKPAGDKQPPRAASFLMFGAKMEDDFAKGGSYDYMGVKFGEEDDDAAYAKCSVTGIDSDHPYCNHYWFVGYGGREGACSRNVLGATDAESSSGHCWPSLYERGILLFGRAKGYYSRGQYDKAYYWLGRAAHLLADAGVPFHVIPHDPSSNIELAHRCYERMVMGHLDVGTIKPAKGKRGELRDIFEAVRSKAEDAAAAQGFVAVEGGAKKPQEKAVGADWSDLQTIELLATGGDALAADVMRPEVYARCEKVLPNWMTMAKSVMPAVLGQTETLFERFFEDLESKKAR